MRCERASWCSRERRGLSICPSSRPLVSLCGPFDFPRIGLRADVVRRFCQLILLRHLLAAGRIVFPFVSSFVSSFVSLARLVGASRVYSLRIACQSVSSRRFAGVSLFRLARRSVSRLLSLVSSVLLVVPRGLDLARLIVSRLARASRQAVRSLVLLGRLVRRVVGRVVFSVSFFSVLGSSARCRFMAMIAAARHLRFRIVAACSPPVAPLWNPIGRWRLAEMGVPFDDTEGRAVLFSSISPSGKDDEGRYG